MLEPYELEPRPEPPPIPGATVVVREQTDELWDALASELVGQAHACVRAFGDFHLAVPGVATLEPLYRLLMVDPRYRGLPWKRTHLWVVAERDVPLADESSAFGVVRGWLAEHSDIPPEQVHPILTGVDEPAGRLERELREVLGWRERGHDRLDYVLLVASSGGSFEAPGPAVATGTGEGDAIVVDARGEASSGVVSLSMGLINASRLVSVVAVGEPGASAAASAVRGDGVPLASLRPIAGELRWYVDRASSEAGLRAGRAAHPSGPGHPGHADGHPDKER